MMCSISYYIDMIYRPIVPSVNMAGINLLNIVVISIISLTSVSPCSRRVHPTTLPPIPSAIASACPIRPSRIILLTVTRSQGGLDAYCHFLSSFPLETVLISVENPSTGLTTQVRGRYIFRGLRNDEVTEIRRAAQTPIYGRITGPYGIRSRGQDRKILAVDHCHGCEAMLRNSPFISTTTNYTIAEAGGLERPQEVAVIDVTDFPSSRLIDVCQVYGNRYDRCRHIGTILDINSKLIPSNPYRETMPCNEKYPNQWDQAAGNAKRDCEILLTQDTDEPIQILGFARGPPIRINDRTTTTTTTRSIRDELFK